MKTATLYKYQERLFDLFIKVTYLMLFLSFLGMSTGILNKYFVWFGEFQYYVRVYICLFLIWRFHPFKSKYEFTNLDRKIAFSAGLIIFTTSILNVYLHTI